MREIKEIHADNETDSNEYDLLVMIHRMASSLAVAKEGGWKLKSCGTDEGYASTTWTNDIIDVNATTIGGERHFYSITKAS